MRLIETAIAASQEKAKAKPAVAVDQRKLAIVIEAKATIQNLLGHVRQACETAQAAAPQWGRTEKLDGVLEMDRTDSTGLRALNGMWKKCGVGIRL